MPEEVDKSTLRQIANYWAYVAYQFGIDLAGMKSALN